MYADEEFKINKIMERFGDTREQAIEHIKKSNNARSTYYSLISNKIWCKKENCNLYINANDTEINVAHKIINYIV